MPEALLHKNKPLAILFALGIMLLLHIGNFVVPSPQVQSSGQLYQLIGCSAWHTALNAALALLLIIISGALFDLILTRFNFLGNISGYPILFFALFASLHPSMGSLSPALLSLPFIVLGLWALAINYGQKHGQFSSLAIGLCFSIASLLYPPFIVLFFFGVTSLAIIKPAHWREFTALVIGFGLPYGIFYSLLYLTDTPVIAWEKPGYDNLVRYFDGFKPTWGFWLSVITCFAVLNLALLNVVNTFNTYKIITRRFFTLIILLPAFLIVASAWPQVPDVDVWWPVVLPFSVLVARLFIDLQKVQFARLIFFLLLLVALLARFDYYFGSTFTYKLVN